MSLNVLDLIRGQLGPALVSQSATQLGESESAVSKAISALLPAVVGALAENTGKPGVLDSLTGSSASSLLGNLVGGVAGNSTIATVLSAIFGDRVPGIVNAVSDYSGVSNTSANSLLYTVTGATIGAVGKYAEDERMDSTAVKQLLHDQRDTVSSLLPAGLSLSSMGVGNLANGDEYPETAKISESPRDEQKVDVNRGGDTHVHVDQNDAHKDTSVWRWLLPLVLLALAAWFLWKQCDKTANTTTSATDSTAMQTEPAAVLTDSADMTDSTTMAPDRVSTTVALPAGQTLNGFKGGVEDQMVSFLNSEEYKNADEAALKEKWFNFDNLNFEFNSTKLTPESQIQLDNIKAILAAYPDAKVKIGAYTDKKGDDATNKKLSQQRADAVKAALGSAQVIAAEGYGEEFATVDENASDDARLVDRKTAIRFTK